MQELIQDNQRSIIFSSHEKTRSRKTYLMKKKNGLALMPIGGFLETIVEAIFKKIHIYIQSRSFFRIKALSTTLNLQIQKGEIFTLRSVVPCARRKRK